MTETTPPLYYVTFKDCDGVSYIDNMSDTGWSASQDSKAKGLFDKEAADRVIRRLKSSSRYQSDPDLGIFQVLMWQATPKDVLLWKGPSKSLMNYLCEGNNKVDLVRLLWEEVSHERRMSLETEADMFHQVMEKYDAADD